MPERMMDEMGRRLDAWGQGAAKGVGSDAFLREVGRVRSRRQAGVAGAGLVAVVLATGGLWALLPRGGGADGAARPGLIAGGGVVEPVEPGGGMDGSAWTMAALSRRISAWDGGAGSLLPEGWSMGWASEPPF